MVAQEEANQVARGHHPVRQEPAEGDTATLGHRKGEGLDVAGDEGLHSACAACLL